MRRKIRRVHLKSPLKVGPHTPAGGRERGGQQNKAISLRTTTVAVTDAVKCSRRLAADKEGAARIKLDHISFVVIGGSCCDGDYLYTSFTRLAPSPSTHKTVKLEGAKPYKQTDINLNLHANVDEPPLFFHFPFLSSYPRLSVSPAPPSFPLTPHLCFFPQ